MAGSGTYTTAYGAVFGISSAASTTTAISLRVDTPAHGTNKIALSAGDLSVGYTVPAPANGAIIAGYVGIGKNSASAPLDVVGNVIISALLTTSTFKMTTGATNGYHMVSDASGNGVWTSLAMTMVTSLTGTANQVIVSASTGAVTLSTPQDIGTSSSPTFGALGLGDSPSTYALRVAGTKNNALIRVDGQTTYVTGVTVGIENLVTLYTETASITAVGLYNLPEFDSIGFGSFSTAYGAKFGIPGAAGATVAISLRADKPYEGNTKIALSAGDIVVGYDVAAPADGAIIKGKVAIGTSSLGGTSANLQVTSDSTVTIQKLTTTNVGSAYITTSGNGLVFNTDAKDMYDFRSGASAGETSPHTAGSSKMAIDANGKVRMNGNYTVLYNSADDPGGVGESGAIYYKSTDKSIKASVPVYQTDSSTGQATAVQQAWMSITPVLIQNITVNKMAGGCGEPCVGSGSWVYPGGGSSFNAWAVGGKITILMGESPTFTEQTGLTTTMDLYLDNIPEEYTRTIALDATAQRGDYIAYTASSYFRASYRVKRNAVVGSISQVKIQFARPTATADVDDGWIPSETMKFDPLAITKIEWWYLHY